MMESVLIVEDDPDALAADCNALGGRFAVLAATNGEDAVRMARRACPAVIVLDVMLPDGRDGFSVFRDLAAHPATRGIPVVFLTDINRVSGLPFGDESIARYLGRQPFAFLEKPVSANRLLETVRAAVAALA